MNGGQPGWSDESDLNSKWAYIKHLENQCWTRDILWIWRTGCVTGKSNATTINLPLPDELSRFVSIEGQKPAWPSNVKLGLPTMLKKNRAQHWTEVKAKASQKFSFYSTSQWLVTPLYSTLVQKRRRKTVSDGFTPAGGSCVRSLPSRFPLSVNVLYL